MVGDPFNLEITVVWPGIARKSSQESESSKKEPASGKWSVEHFNKKL